MLLFDSVARLFLVVSERFARTFEGFGDSSIEGVVLGYRLLRV